MVSLDLELLLENKEIQIVIVEVAEERLTSFLIRKSMLLDTTIKKSNTSIKLNMYLTHFSAGFLRGGIL